MCECVVDRRVENRRSVGGGKASRPVVAVIVLIRARPEPLRHNPFHCADPSGEQVLFDELDFPSVDVLESDGGEVTVFAFRLHHAADCVGGARGGFFNEHGRAVGERLFGHGFMECNSGRNADQIQFSGEFRVHGVGRRIDFCSERAQNSEFVWNLVRVDDDRRGKFRCALFRKLFQIGEVNFAVTGDAEAVKNAVRTARDVGLQLLVSMGSYPESPATPYLQ